MVNSEHFDRDELTGILYKTQQQALRAGEVIHRMRDFIKSHPRQRSTISINELIDEAISLCVDDIKQNNINLSLRFWQGSAANLR